MYSLPILRLILIVFFSSLAMANQAKIEISSPLDKAKIDIKKESQLISSALPARHHSYSSTSQ